jgi:hypothetical protein
LKEDVPYNPLDKKNLGISVEGALLSREVQPLNSIERFIGAGIYAIYFIGDYPAYAPIAVKNRNGAFGVPIYVGKAVPEGARKGLTGLNSNLGPDLYKRLCQHNTSIEQASNLNAEDFYCRYLVVDDIWIPLGESLLIASFSPVWNLVVDGFGNHTPGSGRYNQQKSAWDVIHPGRPWAERCAPNTKSPEQILKAIKKHLSE